MSLRSKIATLARIPLRDWMAPRKLLTINRARRYSMAGYRRLANAYDLAGRVEREGIPGALVECGVWKGGCSAVMARAAKDAGGSRRSVLFDSFQGLPEPTPEDGEKARRYASDRTTGALSAIEKCVGPLEDVQEIFRRFGIDPSGVVIVQGWFQDTVPVEAPRLGPIAVLRLDGDWYESTKVCLDHLYDRVVPGGYVIIDDYGHWEGCRKAVDEFIAARGLAVEMHEVDYTGTYFVKP